MQKRLPHPRDFQRPSKRHLQRSPELRRLSHEFANQLTVINFSCARIRASIPTENTPMVASELARIDKAVSTVCEMLAGLTADDDTSTRSPSDPAQPAKIYPLFKHPPRTR